MNMQRAVNKFANAIYWLETKSARDDVLNMQER